MLTIYCLSGTGNSLTASNWICNKFLQNNIESKIINISSKTSKKNITNKDDFFGFCYPTHGFGIPWLMLKFILNFPKAKQGNKVFLVGSRAGMKLYKLFTPGLSGIALHLPLLILYLKGYKIAGLLPLDMPSNWISIHPGIKSKVANSIIERCKRKTENFANILASGKKKYQLIYFIMIQFDILTIPIYPIYMLIGRYFLAKTFFASSSCNNCGTCITNCPVAAIKKVFNRPFWTFDCESCMRCMNVCQKKSIQTGHLYSVLIIVALLYIPFFVFLKDLINHFLGIKNEILISFIDLIITTIVCLPFFWLSYLIHSFFLKFKWFNKINTFTSLTKYWRRYIATGIKIRDFDNYTI